MDSVVHEASQPAASSRPVLAPASPWADLPAFAPRGPAIEERLESGRCIWLNDNQINLTGPERAWLTRTVNEVVTPDGLAPVGQLSIDFDPACERVVIHHVRILRSGQVRVFDPSAAMQVFHREPDLERAKFDGRLTAHFTIPDLRLGDIVDVAWSHIGGHPLLAGHFAAEWAFDWGCWVGETRIRLLAPRSRDLRFRTWGTPPEPEERQLDEDVVERVWVSRETAPVRGEPDMPPWVRSLSTVACVEAMTWPQVADIFAPLYPVDTPPPADLDAEVARIADRSASAADRTVEALRMVQSALRYQAVSIGAGGFTPRPVEEIWGSRSGDCKDASLLLVIVLRRLGVEACPALVNVVVGWAFGEEPPSLGAFNHCIVRAQIEGETYWLDPTNFPQAGRLDVIVQPRWGWALPLAPGATLESMGEATVQDLGGTDEEFVFGASPDAPARLTVRSVHRSWRADSLRRQLAAGSAAVEESFRAFYDRRYGGAVLAAPMVVEDDAEANAVTLVETYDLTRPWERLTDGRVRFQTYDDLFNAGFQTPRMEGRRHPIDLGMPRRLYHNIVLRVGRDIPMSGWNETASAAGVEMNAIHQVLDAPGDTRLKRTMCVGKRVVAATDASALFDARDRIGTYSGVVLTLAVENGLFPRASSPAATPAPAASGKQAWWTLILPVVLGLSMLGRACTPDAPEPPPAAVMTPDATVSSLSAPELDWRASSGGEAEALIAGPLVSPPTSPAARAPRKPYDAPGHSGAPAQVRQTPATEPAPRATHEASVMTAN